MKDHVRYRDQCGGDVARDNSHDVQVFQAKVMTDIRPHIHAQAAIDYTTRKHAWTRIAVSKRAHAFPSFENHVNLGRSTIVRCECHVLKLEVPG